MKEKEARVIVHANHSKCLKCQKNFKTKDEIIFLKNSNVMHKTCYEDVRKMIQEESNV